ncbi:helix-turn-helix domain-containing protein [Nocardia sp. BSTN01]|uniref:helix-turn-helix domain-containing protein n=1 Tax=Nocardia sp. BSTN01 TaxID=2783665 RepID=UPI001890AFFC|nr:helix-turn-helix transcriptional regulator [Nocardia sp. BSTN01]MBF4996705.1 helix-turn-helix domain-containing protein [Nocardia sp. BSTN01]
MSTSVGQARAALGARLRELRRDARLSGKSMAESCGWHPSKVSRIELGRQQPSEDDLLQWCRTTGSMMVYDDLVATLRNLQSMYLEWRRVVASGRAHRQRQSLEIEGRADHLRWFESWVVPGLLQTPDYARAILIECRKLVPGGRDDIEEAVAVRMTRQRILRSGGRRFAFIIGEAALHQVVGSAAIMAAQLQALIGHAANPRVDLSIVPLAAAAPIGSHGFAMFDRDSVMVETISAELTVTRPSEIAVYDDAFRAMHEIAEHGSAAVGILARIADEHERKHGAADS